MAKQPQPKPQESKAKQPVETKAQGPEMGPEVAGLPVTQVGANPAAALHHPNLLGAQRQGLALSIGRAQGNQYLQRVVASQQEERSTFQRLFGEETRPERQIIEEAIRDESGLDIVRLKGNFKAATPQEKMKLLEIAYARALIVREPIRNQLWESLRGDLPGLATEEKWAMMKLLISGFKSNDYRALLYRIELIYDLWKSFGSEPNAMIELISQPEPMALWKKSDDMDVDLEELPFVEKLTRDFEVDIGYLTLSYLEQNMAYTEKEWRRLGLGEKDLEYNPFGEEEGAEGAIPEREREELKATQEAAAQVAEAQEAQKKLREIPVGYRYKAQMFPFTSLLSDQYEIVHFDPEQKPAYTAQEVGKEGEKLGDWATVKKSHDELEQVVTSLGDRYPGIFAMIQSGREVKTLAEAGPLAARYFVARSLMDVRENIAKTMPKIGGDISVYDLEPIQAQLIQGAQSQTGRKWNEPVLKWVAQRAKSEHESREFWLSLGLSTLAAAAFVFASIASGGTAAIFMAGGLAAGGAQAAMSWERYLDLAQAAKTHVQSRLAIVSQKQVNAALISAILDTALALLDVYGPAKVGVRALRGGSKVAGEMVRAGAAAGAKALDGLESLRAAGGLDSLTVDAATQINRQAVIEEAVTAVGVEETVRRSGKSLDELIQLVGADSAAGKQLNYYRNVYQQRFAPHELTKKVYKIKSGQASDLLENDRVMMQVLEEEGPVAALRKGGGWQHLASQLDAYTMTGQRLSVWRQQLWEELEAAVSLGKGDYVMEAAGGKGFGLRLSLEFVGENAVENSQKARAFLAGRVGVAADEVEGLLSMSIKANPKAAANTSEITIPGWRQIDDEVTEEMLTPPGWGQMDEVTEVTTPAGVGNIGEPTKVMNQKQLEKLKTQSKDKDLDFRREPTQEAKDTPADLIKQWQADGVNHPMFTTAEAMTEFCVRVFKRPIEPIQHLFFHPNWASFAQAFHRHYPHGNPSNLVGFFDPITKFIHISPLTRNMESVFHEAIHHMAHMMRPGIDREIGTFLDEGITEWLVRVHSAGRVGTGYEVNVAFTQQLAQVLGYEAVSSVVVHGTVEKLWETVLRAMGNDMDRTRQFFAALQRVSNNGVGVDQAALAEAEQLLRAMAAGPTR